MPLFSAASAHWWWWLGRETAQIPFGWNTWNDDVGSPSLTEVGSTNATPCSFAVHWNRTTTDPTVSSSFGDYIIFETHVGSKFCHSNQACVHQRHTCFHRCKWASSSFAHCLDQGQISVRLCLESQHQYAEELFQRQHSISQDLILVIFLLAVSKFYGFIAWNYFLHFFEDGLDRRYKEIRESV